MQQIQQIQYRHSGNRVGVYNATLGAADITTIQTYLRNRYLLW